MAIRLKYLKPADFQKQRILILPRHPFFVRVSLLFVGTEECFVRVSLLSVDKEVCLCQSFSSVCGHRNVSLSNFLFCLWTQKCVFFRVKIVCSRIIRICVAFFPYNFDIWKSLPEPHTQTWLRFALTGDDSLHSTDTHKNIYILQLNHFILSNIIIVFGKNRNIFICFVHLCVHRQKRMKIFLFYEIR